MAFALRTLSDLDVKNKRVLLRVDFNLPLNKAGEITDDTRLRAAIPTIRALLAGGAAIIILSHIGKSGENLSLLPCAKRVSALLEKEVPLLKLPEAERAAKNLQAGDLLMVENLRNFPEEQRPTEAFAQRLAALGECFVSDSFATLHRDDTSITRLPLLFPNQSAAGLLVEREVAVLQNLLTHPKKPFYCLIGGSKVSSKLAVMKALLKRCDGLFIGGAMAFTFMKAAGRAVGESPVEEALLPVAKELLAGPIPIHLPIDFVCASSRDSQKITSTNEIGDGLKGFDIGPKTVALFSKAFSDAKTIFWNGPVGLFEDERFANGTYGLAKSLAKLTNVVTVVGGGDSVAAIAECGLLTCFSHVSTGGGATLEFIELGTLPGLMPLMQKS